MDITIQVLLAASYAIAIGLELIVTGTLEGIGGEIGKGIYEKFLNLLAKSHPNAANEIKEKNVHDYEKLFNEIESEAHVNREFAQAVEELALTAKEHPLPNMDDVVQNFEAVEELKPQVLELRSLINKWRKEVVNANEIIKFLPDATYDQAERCATQVKRLRRLQSFFSENSQELKGYEGLLATAEKALDYEKPYCIAVVGSTGVGKSTTINAMLGRELLKAGSGKPVTGAALEIFISDASEGEEDEKAEVTYRDQSNIEQLIHKNLVEQYGLDKSQLSGEIDDNFFEALNSLKYDHDGNEGQQEFEELLNTIKDLVGQYTNHRTGTEKRNFSLHNAQDCDSLIELINENSTLNNDPKTRKVGLVKSVRYYIKSDKSTDDLQTLRLPNNVCLVDLPGMDGTKLHNIIIREGIEDADAVIVIQPPDRVSDLRKLNLLKLISSEGTGQSDERIFIVLNGIDKLPYDEIPKDVLDAMDEVVECFPGYQNSSQLSKRGGDKPYFITHAVAAYYAQQRIKGEQLNEPDKYEAMKSLLLKSYVSRSQAHDEQDDLKVVEASGIPKLVEEITKFARDQRIEGQIRDGKQALDTIITSLESRYQSELSELSGAQTSRKQKVELQLEDKKNKLKVKLANFREKSILNEFEGDSWPQTLENTTESICEDAAISLRENMPDIWRKHFTSDLDRLTKEGKIAANSFVNPLLSDAQICLWHKLNIFMPRLAEWFVQFYKDKFKESGKVNEIRNECGNSISRKTGELESKIEDLIREMSSKMEQMSQRIAMTKMTEPSNYFINEVYKVNDQGVDDQGVDDQGVDDQGNDTLQDILEEIELNYETYGSELDAEKFEDFIICVKTNYLQAVVKSCVDDLLSLYRYELICIEDGLFSFIDEVFFDVRDCGDKSRIAQFLSNSNSNFERVQLLRIRTELLGSITSDIKSS